MAVVELRTLGQKKLAKRSGEAAGFIQRFEYCVANAGSFTNYLSKMEHYEDTEIDAKTLRSCRSGSLQCRET